jgi:transcriptional regulator with XRE-family HTH domain
MTVSRMPREKSQFSPEYKILLRTLVRLREESGRTQADVAKAMNRTQSVISKSELGARRLDFIEVRQYCLGLGLNMAQFIEVIEKELASSPEMKKGKMRRAKKP